ncbi:MAG: DUF1080 domain-containing protein, partial [Eudoraea sp.]|nr:DUF1080 domain-containing protein [Eudoraea sp.]
MKNLSIFLVLLVLASACRDKKEATLEQEQNVVFLSQAIEWISLMTPESWRGYNQDTLPDNWAIADDIIECFGKAGDMGGDIITQEQFDNF